MANVLIVDDAPDICMFLCDLFQGAGHATVVAKTLAEALRAAKQYMFDAVLLDVNMPDGSGMDYIQELRSGYNAPEIIVITGVADRSGAIHALRNGCWDYLEKPLVPSALLTMFDRLLEYRASFRKPAIPPLPERTGTIGQSPAMLVCLQQVALAASGETNIHITGETGTGKELFAKLVHRNSNRKDKPFVTVDCAALSESLGASMLFGHTRGAFTGADSARQGYIMQAHTGTLMLDEVGELSLDLQKMFLRVLQEHRFRPLGASSETRSDFRLISATNRNLEEMVAQGTFRADLYYRLRGMIIQLPPLRSRISDVRLFCEEICREYCRKHQMEHKVFSADFWDVVEEHSWPGNVRELIAAMEHALHLAGSSLVVLPQYLPASVRVGRFSSPAQVKHEQPAAAPISHAHITDAEPLQPAANKLLLPDENGELPTLKQLQEQAVARLEKTYLVELMELTGGDIQEACAIAGLSRSRLYKYLQQHKIRRSMWQAEIVDI